MKRTSSIAPPLATARLLGAAANAGSQTSAPTHSCDPDQPAETTA